MLSTIYNILILIVSFINVNFHHQFLFYLMKNQKNLPPRNHLDPLNNITI